MLEGVFAARRRETERFFSRKIATPEGMTQRIRLRGQAKLQARGMIEFPHA